jgi:hypothetical protein
VAEAPFGDGARVADALERAGVADRTQYAPIVDHDGSLTHVGRRGAGPIHVTLEDGKIKFSREADEAGFWAVVQHFLLNDPAYAAQNTGHPELLHYLRAKLPQPPLRIERVRESYLKHSPATEKSKQEALAPFDRLVKFAHATTLDDLTDRKLERSGFSCSASR